MATTAMSDSGRLGSDSTTGHDTASRSLALLPQKYTEATPSFGGGAIEGVSPGKVPPLGLICVFVGRTARQQAAETGTKERAADTTSFPFPGCHLPTTACGPAPEMAEGGVQCHVQRCATSNIKRSDLASAWDGLGVLPSWSDDGGNISAFDRYDTMIGSFATVRGGDPSAEKMMSSTVSTPERTIRSCVRYSLLGAQGRTRT